MGRIAFALATLAAVSAVAHAEPPSREALPPELRDWTAWALHGKEAARCPFFQGDANAAAGRCAWPGRLRLDLDERGGRFSQEWTVVEPSSVPLPGDEERWPLDVTVDGSRAAVIEGGGVPQVMLDKGKSSIAGSFEWGALPESLP